MPVPTVTQLDKHVKKTQNQYVKTKKKISGETLLRKSKQKSTESIHKKSNAVMQFQRDDSGLARYKKNVSPAVINHQLNNALSTVGSEERGGEVSATPRNSNYNQVGSNRYLQKTGGEMIAPKEIKDLAKNQISKKRK